MWLYVVMKPKEYEYYFTRCAVIINALEFFFKLIISKILIIMNMLNIYIDCNSYCYITNTSSIFHSRTGRERTPEEQRTQAAATYLVTWFTTHHRFSTSHRSTTFTLISPWFTSAHVLLQQWPVPPLPTPPLR